MHQAQLGDVPIKRDQIPALDFGPGSGQHIAEDA